ncbi:hypothetical protein FRC01_010840 [Tulasnella sp. 417]|nr:hypothetical protein FRC01_010840 [Tulasnella sp. 417]
MPASRIKSKKRKSQTSSTSAHGVASAVVAFAYEDRKVAVPRPETYKARPALFSDAVALAQKYCVPDMPVPDSCVIIEAQIPSTPDLGKTELNSDTWHVVSSEIKVFEIRYLKPDDDKPPREPIMPHDDKPQGQSLKHNDDQPPGESREAASNDKFTIQVKTATGRIYYFRLSPRITVAKIKRHLQDKEGIHPSEQVLVAWDGSWLRDDLTMQEYDIQKGDTIYMRRSQVGGKPIIYLYPSTTTNATVELSLSLDWNLSAVYPIPPELKPTRLGSESADYGQIVKWDVTAHPDGTMSVVTAGDTVEASYLFWEAKTHPQPPQLERSKLSRIPIEDMGLDVPEEFNPSSSQCSPQDSVLLPVGDVPAYLDKALLALGLHTEGRTSFITFWLPFILKHDHIALRFIRQSDLDSTATLQISPTPDVVTRIFMLFQGVPGGELDHWKDAMGQLKKGSGGSFTMWRDIVGVETEDRQKDEKLFRVVEWGGMEVLNGRIL